MLSQSVLEQAADLLELCRRSHVMIATAESCTGGLLSAALTSIAGSSDVFDRGFVTYSNEAKQQMLGVDISLINTYGAVSEQVAIAMAQGALNGSRAMISVSVTGIAGPGGGSPEKPVGRVHLASASQTGVVQHIKHDFGSIGRDNIRGQSVISALKLVETVLKSSR